MGGGGAVFGVVRDPVSGDYSLELYQPLTHGQTDNSATSEVETGFEDNLPLDFTVTVTDANGAAAQSDFSIAVNDDSPTAAIELSQSHVIVDESVGANPSDANAGDEVGHGDPFGLGNLLGFQQRAMISSAGSETGSDSAGATVAISLALSGDGTTDMTTTDGRAIMLVDESGVIVGRASDGTAAFALGVDGSTGEVTLAQYQSLEHDAPGRPDESLRLTGLVDAVVTVTDGDGDVSTATHDLGDSIRFQDDSPTGADDAATADTPLIHGNVITGDGVSGADDPGSDGFAASGAVSGVRVGGETDGGALSSAGTVVDGHFGQLTLNADGSYAYETTNSGQIPQQGGEDVFTYQITDGDGDTDLAQLVVRVEPPVQPSGPQFIVGENVDDNANSSTPHAIGDGAGSIIGDSGPDILVGDSGGGKSGPENINLILALDTSGSMNRMIQYGDTHITRLDALKLSIEKVLNQLESGDAENVRVHAIQFSNSAEQIGHGTYDLIVNGNVNTGDMSNLLAAIGDEHSEGLTASGGTNFEAALQLAINYADSDAPLTGEGVVNQTLFLSDGVPTLYLGDKDTHDGNTTDLTDVYGHRNSEHTINVNNALNQLLGQDNGDAAPDNVNEVNVLEGRTPLDHGSLIAHSFHIDAIGIATPTGEAGVGLDGASILDQVEGADYGSGAAQVVTNTSDLTDALHDTLHDGGLTPSLNGLGADVISGGDGADLIFGDALNTDTLAAAQGLDVSAGASLQVFELLEAGQGSDAGWNRADTIGYIQAHPGELAVESAISTTGRTGGNDILSGGAGDDMIFGQEGDDVIHGGSGADSLSGGSGADTIFGQEGDDVIHGGSGADNLSGGSGADTFVFDASALTDAASGLTDTLHDYNAAQGDVIDLSQIADTDDALSLSGNHLLLDTGTGDGAVAIANFTSGVTTISALVGESGTENQISVTIA